MFISRISRMSAYSYILSSPFTPLPLRQLLIRHKFYKEMYIKKQKVRFEQKCLHSPIILVYPIYRIDEEHTEE
jgi:hypothetical protein